MPTPLRTSRPHSHGFVCDLCQAIQTANLVLSLRKATA